MRFVKYLIVFAALIIVTSTFMLVTDLQIGEYITNTNQSITRFKAQLPSVFRLVSVYSSYILVLLVSSLFIEKNSNRATINLISKLESYDQFTRQTNKNITGIDSKSLFILGLFSISVVAVRNWSCFFSGYFKYDDFEFFSTNRTEPLLSLLLSPHGDHFLPLFRLEIAVMSFFFGVNPVYYNLLVLSVFALILLFAGLLLREMKTSQISIVLFAILCIGWIDWGEISAGYFCVSIYLQIALLSLISIWSYFRWVNTLAYIFKVISVACIGCALFLDISGIWVPLGLIAFSFGEFSSGSSRLHIGNWFKSNRWMLSAIVIIYCAFAAFNFYVFFISKHGVFLSMSGSYRHTFFSFLTQMFYLISGGLLLSPFFPIGFNLLPTVILAPLLVVLLLLVCYIISKAFRNADREVRWHICSVILIILMTTMIVAVGRPMTGFSYALVAKYTGVIYIWFCLLVCLVWNHYWHKQDLPGKSRMANISLLFLLFFIGQQIFFDSILLLSKAEAAGYSVNIAEAKTRKNNVNEIRHNLILPLLSLHRRELRIPTLDGNYIFNVYPRLFKYNLSHYADFVVPEGKRVVLLRNKAMQGWAAKDVVEVASLRSNTDNEFIQILENDSYVQRLYLSSVELIANTVSDTAIKTDSIKPGQLVKTTALSQLPNGGVSFHSDGSAELIIDKGDWNPEEKHELVLKVETQGGTITDNVKLEVHFTGKLKIPYNKSNIPIASRKKNILSIDLLQIYSYSLNPRVENLRIGFPVPGNYLVSGVSLI